MSDGDRRFELNWVQSLAGALAAVTSAVLLSTVGVAGTLVGAALGSLAVTVGSAVYSYYLRATHDRVASAGTVAASRIGRGRSGGSGPAPEDSAAGATATDEKVAEAGKDLPPARADLEVAKNPPAGGFTTVLAGLPWKRIAVVATGLFVTAMLVILTFELITGRAVSSYTGGSDSDRRTSIPGLGGGGDRDDPQPSPGETPSGEPDESTGETEQPTPAPTAATEETAAPTSTDAPAETAETATSGSAPSVTPSPTPVAPTTPPPTP